MAQEQKTYLTPEEEIRALESALEEKKRVFAEQKKEMPEEKEVFREVLREHVEAIKPTTEEKMPFEHPPLSSHPPSGTTDDDAKKDREREEQVRALIEIALTKGISEAVRIAGLNSPYLLDDLHDHLADDFYEKLVALKKITQL
ncbi:MAG: hypothetical protein HYZ69_00935 [Candidatus Colwellbacteria bacterium]|nr:hypothetical protein [Candidatus Colwellbacteria bacterium]